MALVLEGLALAIEGAGLIIDCACCIKEKCEAIACLKDNDCDEAGLTPDAECFCRKERCTDNPACTGDEDCPEGLVCIDGECLPPCRGQSCADDEDCPEGCVCADGGCFDPTKVFYCWGDANDPDADGSCRAGVPTPPDYTTKGGPFLSLGLCAMSGCKTKYECNPVVEDCYPSVTGTYDTLTECQSNCGSDGDLGRCCQSTVTYDVNGDVTQVEQDCADCCNGDKVPIDPNNPGLGTKCENTNACKKSQCISDDPPSTFPAERVFRQFNSLFDNCDECPTSPLGPCCFEDDNPQSATFGELICDEHDEFYCTKFLNGDWKGRTWFTCTDERVDTGREFACEKCNGPNDCSCGQGEFCFNQKCNECKNPNPIPTVEGRIAEVRFDDKSVIDGDPKIYRKYYFRVLTCSGQSGIDYPNERVRILGQKKGEADLIELLIVDNLSATINGYTVYSDDQCYEQILAEKVDNDPEFIGLCYFWQDPEILAPQCFPVSYSCECEFTPDPCPECHTQEFIDKTGFPPLYETYFWLPVINNNQISPPVRDECFTVNGCAERLFDNSRGYWILETWSYGWNGVEDVNTWNRARFRYIAVLPDGSFADVTDEWLTGLPTPDGIYRDCLTKAQTGICDELDDETGDCIDSNNCIGSDCESPLEIPQPAFPPDPLMTCLPNQRKSPSFNPLP